MHDVQTLSSCLEQLENTFGRVDGLHWQHDLEIDQRMCETKRGLRIIDQSLDSIERAPNLGSLWFHA